MEKCFKCRRYFSTTIELIVLNTLYFSFSLIQKKRKLYIYGGQRGKEDIHDFITYDVNTQTLEFLNRNANGGQTAGSAAGSASNASCSATKTNPDGKREPSPVALRATIDCERNEIYIFSVS